MATMILNFLLRLCSLFLAVIAINVGYSVSQPLYTSSSSLVSSSLNIVNDIYTARPFNKAPENRSSNDGKENNFYSQQQGIKLINQDDTTNLQSQRLLQSTTTTIPLPYRVNCGQNTTSGNYTDPNTGKLWVPDRYFLSGNMVNRCTNALQQNITLPDHLCRTRNGNFTYNFPVPYNGTYKLTLYFAETFFKASGRRIFNVSVEGIDILSRLDIHAVTGGIFRPMNRTFTVNVTDGFLSVRYVSLLDRATISAIEIEDGRPSKLSTVRINCGSFVPYVDTIPNNTWSADINFDNGNRYNACPASILNTDIDTVFCSERWFAGVPGFNGTYTIPVLPGVYTVRLLFAEMYFATNKSRVFNIYLQNQKIRTNFDIHALAGGRNMSLIVSSVATVSSIDPNVRLIFENLVQFAKISGIEIVEYDRSVVAAPTRPPTRMPTQAPTSNTFNPILINSGSSIPFTDSLAREFLADQFFTGGITVSYAEPITNTVDDYLYQNSRDGDTFSYEIPVPVGSYAVTLLFSESQYNATRQRLFDVLVENELVRNIDIFQNAGGSFTASRLQVFQLVEDNFLSIRFTRSSEFPDAGVPTLSGIEIALDQPHVAHAVATGPYVGTVVNPVTNKADVQLVGQTSHTHGVGLSLTDFTWKEGNTVLGTTVNSNYSFGVGLHTISLTIKDDGGNLNTEVTTVSINPFGFPAITSLVPNSGNLTGQYPVIIRGSGFNYSTTQMNVMFGTTVFNGSAIYVINQTAIQVLAPSSTVAQAVSVTVQTPLGTSVVSEFSYIGAVPIMWQELFLLSYLQPTVGRFGPDRRLYLGTRYGRILKVTLNNDFTSVTNTIVSLVNKEYKETILGVALDPMDTKANPDVYFTMNRFFHQWNQSSSDLTVAGKIRRASGVNLETVVDIITGLPCSDIDHGLNGLEFDDNGALYFTSGSHTNGGIPGPLSSSRQLKENFLSAAINVAYLNHPNFNGTIQWSAPDDGNMIAKGIDVFAPGVRNSYSVTMHSNGLMYATDNGPNVEYGPMSTGCNGESTFDKKRDDEIIIVEKGNYYGSPNFKRASFFNDSRQCVWHGPESPDSLNHTAPIITHQSSIDGITEFHGNHFGGQLRYNLIYLRYGAINNINRVILTPDGRAAIPSLMKKGLAMNIGNVGLDITQAPNGNLVEMRFGNSSVYAYAPVEPATTALIAKTCFPRRGRSSGGTTLSIYGINLNSRSPNVTVTVGGVNCPTTFISSTNVDCTLPGGTGTVDIVVRNGAASSTFERGYRYISGTLPLGFVLPVYTG